jgi:thioredoxin reductase (NADPH)
MERNVVIIGGGPAGYTAAIYAARANLKPLVLAGYAAGGQLVTTTEVENYPGFPEGIMGPDLMQNMQKQAERFGAEILYKDVSNVDFSKHPFTITYEDTTVQAKAVIIATGASPRKLGLESESKLWSKGVTSCATCDGAFYKGKEVAVAGGGDSAMEEAVFLTRFANKVTIVHRREELRASKIMAERAQKNPKIQWALGQVVEEVLGNGKVSGLRLKDAKTGKASDLKVDGLFLAIGHIPNSALFKNVIKTDEEGYILTDNKTQTNIPGVFACGDVVDHTFRQAITAAGSGCASAISAERYLEALGHHS